MTFKPVTLCFALAFQVYVANANAAVFDAIDRGWYMESGQHVSSIQNTLTGFFDCCNFGEHRSYFIFDLTSLNEPVGQATLKLELHGYSSPDPFETATLWDVTPSTIPILDIDYSSGSATGQSIFADLGTGVSYGSIDIATPGFTSVVLPPGSTILEISLNSSAITDIVASTGGLFALGVSLSTISGNPVDEHVLFSFGDEVRTHQLITSPIPLPATIWLFGSGLVGLIGIARRKKS